MATVALGSIRKQIESGAPPRGLWCDFPLGRPLGKPGDPEFQHRVLEAAFALLDSSEPVLAVFDQAIPDSGDEMLACPVPPHHDPDVHPAVDEARGLRAAYDRGMAMSDGRFGAGRVVDAADIPTTIEAFIEHGSIARTIDSDPTRAQSILDAVAAIGIDLESVAHTLEEEGVAAFVKSFDELIASLTTKADSLL